MGTNFYLTTTNKQARDDYFGYDYELIDEPEFAWAIHIAKTSCGWLPLFQSHDCFKSVKQLKELYEMGYFKIIDEYGSTYDWDQFDERVLQFNGGVKGTIERVKHDNDDKNDKFYDHNMPEYLPVSHFEYANGKYVDEMGYFNDPQGYEFTGREFS